MLGDAHNVPTDIPFAENAQVLEAFFKLALMPGPRAMWDIFPSLNYKATLDVLETCRKYGADHLEDRFRKSSEAILWSPGGPEKAFLIGRELGDRVMWLRAINKMSFAGNPHADKLLLEHMRENDLGALRIAFRSTSHLGSSLKRDLIAERFITYLQSLDGAEEVSPIVHKTKSSREIDCLPCSFSESEAGGLAGSL